MNLSGRGTLSYRWSCGCGIQVGLRVALLTKLGDGPAAAGVLDAAVAHWSASKVTASLLKLPILEGGQIEHIPECAFLWRERIRFS